MEAYRDELAAGLAAARARTAAGSLSLSLPAARGAGGRGTGRGGHGSDEEEAHGEGELVNARAAEKEYALRRRLAHVLRCVDDLEEEVEGAGAGERRWDDAGSVASSSSSSDWDADSMGGSSGIGRKRARVRARAGGGRKAREKRARAALEELELQSTRAFLLTLQHGASGAGETAGFRGENGGQGLGDAGLPLPIGVESESIAALEAMLEQLAHMCGLRMVQVTQTRLPTVYQTAWHLRGQPCSNLRPDGSRTEEEEEEEEEEGRINASLAFSARFRVDEKSSRVSELVLTCPDAARLEIGGALEHCQRIGCLRSFCATYSQYCEIFLERERLFSRLERQWPGSVQVVGAGGVTALPFDVLSRVLEVRAFGGEMLWLIWEPYFQMQRLNAAGSAADGDEDEDEDEDEDDDDDELEIDKGKEKGKGKGKSKGSSSSSARQPQLDEEFKNLREGYSLRTRVELWRRVKPDGECAHDVNFADLAKKMGLAAALAAVVEKLL